MTSSTRFVGLGSMGSGMVRNLLKNGFAVTVDDLSPERVAAVVADGATAGAPGPITEPVVMISVPGPPEVEAVCFGEQGLLSRMQPGSVLINLSTVNLESAKQLDAAATERGILCVDAPVTGAADGAADGTLVIMCGATDEALAAARPALEAISASIHHMGPTSTGTAAKLLTNMLWFIHVTALSDSLSLATRCGIDPDTFATLVRDSAGNSWVAGHDLPNILADDDDESFTLALCVKDLRLIGEIESEMGYTSDLATAARARFGAAYEQYGPQAGELAVTRLAEQAAKTSIRSR